MAGVQLDPRATAEPRDLSAAVEAKYGPGSFEAMSRRLGTLGSEIGIRYRFDRALRVGTFDAHRVILWAQAVDGPGAHALIESLFRAYFTDGANVADRATLVDLAENAGFDREKCTDMLASRSWADDVVTDQAEAMEAFVTGVPAVLYNGATIIPGAQDTDTMEGILRRLVAKVG